MRKVFVNPSPICAFICENLREIYNRCLFPKDPADFYNSQRHTQRQQKSAMNLRDLRDLREKIKRHFFSRRSRRFRRFIAD